MSRASSPSVRKSVSGISPSSVTASSDSSPSVAARILDSRAEAERTSARASRSERAGESAPRSAARRSSRRGAARPRSPRRPPRAPPPSGPGTRRTGLAGRRASTRRRRPHACPRRPGTRGRARQRGPRRCRVPAGWRRVARTNRGPRPDGLAPLHPSLPDAGDHPAPDHQAPESSSRTIAFARRPSARPRTRCISGPITAPRSPGPLAPRSSITSRAIARSSSSPSWLGR